MLRKAVLLTMLLMLLGIGSAFAYQIDSLASGSEAVVPPTQVFVNPGGLGDVLIYGYYNVRDNRENFFTVVNTSTQYGVRARIRFLEASNVNNAQGLCQGSYEVLDFDLCLSKGDVWSGVIRNVNGTARLFSADSDTAIDASALRTRSDESTNPDPDFATAFPNGVAFKTGSDTPQNIQPDQTLEGYFIVIAENQLDEVTEGGNCGKNLTDNLIPDVGNVLMGDNFLVDMDNLEVFAYNATALGDFFIGSFGNNPQDANPNLGSGDDGLTGLNYALTKNMLYSMYDLESEILGKTEVIVTFPTKQLTALAAGGITFNSTTGKCTAGNADIFDDPRILPTVYNDQEDTDVSVCAFSPCVTTDIELPYEVNVIDLNGSNIFSSTVEVPVTTKFDFGWLSINLVDASSTPSPAHQTTYGGRTSLGLPVIGYTAVSVGGGAGTHMMPLQYSTNVQ